MRHIVQSIPFESQKKNRDIVIDLALVKVYEGSVAGKKIIAREIQRELTETRMSISKTLEYHDSSECRIQSIVKHLGMQK